MKNSDNRSNVIDLNAARRWALLSWMEAVSAKSREDSLDMDLEDWLAALDNECRRSHTRIAASPLPDKVVWLSDYRAIRSASELRSVNSE